MIDRLSRRARTSAVGRSSSSTSTARSSFGRRSDSYSVAWQSCSSSPFGDRMALGLGRLGARIPLRTRCSKGDPPSPESGKNDKGDRLSTDWDRAWAKFRKQGKKSLLSEFNPDKYVSWNPRRSDYPLSEEVDPIKRTERSNLMLWTSPQFTLVGAIIVVTMLLIYTILAPLK